MKNYFALCALLIAIFATAQDKKQTPKTPFFWESSNVYFLLTDRFNDGDKTNNKTYNRNKPTGKLRGFEGGDLRGVIQKIDQNYFTNLGINVIWMTPIVEQIQIGRAHV